MAKTKRQIKKATKNKRSAPKVSRNKFAGADDVYTTKNKIAIRRIKSTIDKTGNITLTDTTRYIPKTDANLKAARAVHCRIRQGRN